MNRLLFYFACFFLLLISCKKEKLDIVPECKEPRHINTELKQILDSIPDFYLEGKDLIFKNSDGDTILFQKKHHIDTTFTQGYYTVCTKDTSWSTVDREQVAILYYAAHPNKNLRLDIVLHTVLTQVKDSTLISEMAFYYPAAKSSPLNYSLLGIEGIFFLRSDGTTTKGNFTKSVKLLNKEFLNLFVISGQVENGVYYNGSLGIIAFKDAREKLWVLDEIVN